jgi:hypothetical protein
MTKVIQTSRSTLDQATRQVREAELDSVTGGFIRCSAQQAISAVGDALSSMARKA